MASNKAVLGRTTAMLAETAVIYACGLAVLAAYVRREQLLTVGVAPFVLAICSRSPRPRLVRR
ncbi:MAG: hypothetical protein KKG69_10685 [Alphaproteobacteria bacterium]|nr:hypothetical protein [Alphaproteobacteria bacterium]MBU2163078.1 hypothetical protein [Alphaproteobacteria bacterium]MBU2231727.1 hypothetical protein [Alphaproteobacteria bacterium]TAJ43307.1 MAG: hypothetical protein EPO54_08055 [Brevundimonas sp.]